MLILKLLGMIDLIGAGLFLLLVFGVAPPLQLVLFSAGLLLLKSMFILTGDPLSALDFIASMLLLISLIVSLPTLLVWTPALLLMAKGAGSML
ncbi:hypothetical protein EXS73_00325 [Candidatus Pacearchaeota archaeon]|nr:hypothetical protein [Candidatus Pacearchaeota archaeon]